MTVACAAGRAEGSGRTAQVLRKACRVPAVLFLILLLGAGLPGCRRKSAEPVPVPLPHQDESAAEPLPFPEALQEEEFPPPSATAESVDEILRDVLNVYQHEMLKYYSDEGVLRTVYECNGRRVQDERSVSVTFQKPNYLCMKVMNGSLICDGEYLWGTIHSTSYDGQVLKVKAPHLFSSIREFYPDRQLAEAMYLPQMDDVFWPPPQLILMMAREPLKTLIGSSGFKPALGFTPAKLLQPRYVRFNRENPDAEKIACDRISVNSSGGERVFWIDRKTKGIVRIELPIEHIAVPCGVDRVLERTLDFPNQVISNEVPPSDTVPPKEFTVSNSPGVKEVEHFTPVELDFLGQKAPPIRLTPLFSGDSPVALDEASETIRVFALWKGPMCPEDWKDTKELFKEIANTAIRYRNDSRFVFYAVNIDESQQSDTDVIAGYGQLGYDYPLYRVRPADLKKPPFSFLQNPSLFIVDGDGVIQKFYHKPTSHVTLLSNMLSLEQGKDIYKNDIYNFSVRDRKFESLLLLTEESDYYAADIRTPSEQIKYAPHSDPQRMSMEKVWEVDLPDAANPLVITDDGQENPEFMPKESIVVPFGGSKIALIDAKGKVVRTKSSGTGEPVSFVRTARASDGKRYFAVSSFLDTHKVSLLGSNLETINIVDLKKDRKQWVADALLNDENLDGDPELIVALCGDAVANDIPIHGIYSLETQSKDGSNRCFSNWKDELVMSPFQIGFIREKVPGAAPRRALMAMTAPEETVGQLIETDLGNGQRLKMIDTPDDISIRWFTPPDDADDQKRTTETVAVILTHAGSEDPYFAIISLDGKILSETKLTDSTWGDHLDRIIAGELDRDGEAEWIVPTREGVIWFFEQDGTLFDKFSLGREVTGAAIASWHDGTFLVITHNNGVVVYKIKLNKGSK